MTNAILWLLQRADKEYEIIKANQSQSQPHKTEQSQENQNEKVKCYVVIRRACIVCIFAEKIK